MGIYLSNLETKASQASALLGRRSPMMLNVTSPAKYPGVLIIQGRAAILKLVRVMQFQAARFLAVLTPPSASV